MSQLPKVLAVRDRLPHLKTVIVIGAGAHGSAFLDWDRLLAAASDSFTTVDTAAEDPALLIYTSGTTGQPKGALHAHRVMLGSVPPVEQWLSHWPQRQRGDVDAGRMGVDRRPLRRPLPGLVLRHAGGGASLRQVRSRTRLRAAGTGTRSASASSRRPRSR